MNLYDRLDTVVACKSPAGRPTDPASIERLFHRLTEALADLPGAVKTPRQRVQREDQR